MEGKNCWFFTKKVLSYKVKIAISCCTHSFYTQLTSSPCIHRKKESKTGKQTKNSCKKDFFGEMQHERVDCKNSRLPFPVFVVVDVVKCNVELDRCDRFEILV